MEERAACSAEAGNSLQRSRGEIADLKVHIQKLRSQILSTKSHVSVRSAHLGVEQGGARDTRSRPLSRTHTVTHAESKQALAE